MRHLSAEERKRLAMATLEFADRGSLNPDPRLMDFVRELLGVNQGLPKAVSTPEEDLEDTKAKEPMEPTKILPRPLPKREFPETPPAPRPVIRVRSQEEMLADLERLNMSMSTGVPRDVRVDITQWANKEKVTLKFARHRVPEIHEYLRTHGWKVITLSEVAKEFNKMINGW
jgi:hypothetical protein